jgi:hypothetical protein
MLLAASDLPGTQRVLPTQQHAAQLYTTQPMAPSLLAVPSVVVGPAANWLSQQLDQHPAASPHSVPLANSPMHQIHL